ncbi:hypothetical protein ACRAWG_11635 [Methylobacterium sp. P31]
MGKTAADADHSGTPEREALGMRSVALVFATIVAGIASFYAGLAVL